MRPSWLEVLDRSMFKSKVKLVYCDARGVIVCWGLSKHDFEYDE